MVDNIESAWKPFKNFAEWLVNEMNPETIVDLGVDYGYSTFVFANSMKNGKVYGVDWFKGDEQTGYRNTLEFVNTKKNELKLNDKVEIIQETFKKALEKWDKNIDILHIDGQHNYVNVKHDFEGWSKFDPKIILLSTCYHFHPGFDVHKVYGEVDGYLKGYFKEKPGLAVMTKDQNLFEKIIVSFPNFMVFPKILV